ncbi:hypothetical protein FACS1894124_5030 [Spirochaetia bacterium]|nr:hypothetical protein FACS1894124_5030 [Spirochaetia bacterium]
MPEGDYIITGGFPCQDLSNTGKGVGLDGERSGLYKEYIRIISEIRPRFAIMENVSSIFRFDIGKLFGYLASLGYDAEWFIDWASNYGLPHYRERFFLCAYPQGVGQEKIFNRKNFKNKQL